MGLYSPKIRFDFWIFFLFIAYNLPITVITVLFLLLLLFLPVPLWFFDGRVLLRLLQALDLLLPLGIPMIGLLNFLSNRSETWVWLRNCANRELNGRFGVTVLRGRLGQFRNRVLRV